MIWYFPQQAGDFRLEADGKQSRLVLDHATGREMDQVGEFLTDAVQRKWLKKGVTVNATDLVPLKASVADAGRVLLKYVRQKRGTLTAVKMVGGQLVATDQFGGELGETELDALMAEETTAAVSVSRPTPSCPDCQPGAIERASEVLQAFLSPSEHADWARVRQIVVTGGLSGHRYLLSHRHHPRAVKDTRICYDLDGRYEVKFFDWSVPPEEEVLAAKLILEHREPWLRNEATLFHVYQEARAEPLFKNPFGDKADGTSDAVFFEGVGLGLRGLQ